jgi:hypothetical protein
VVQFLAIIISAFIVGYQLKSAKTNEIDFKIHEIHKEQYQKLIDLIKPIFIAVKNQEKYEINQTEWTDVQMGMSMYASEHVLKAYTKLLRSSLERKDSLLINRQIGDLILLMRKEVGLNDKNLTSRDVLSPFINDIYNPKYDEYFR